MSSSDPHDQGDKQIYPVSYKHSEEKKRALSGCYHERERMRENRRAQMGRGHWRAGGCLYHQLGGDGGCIRDGGVQIQEEGVGPQPSNSVLAGRTVFTCGDMGEAGGITVGGNVSCTSHHGEQDEDFFKN